MHAAVVCMMRLRDSRSEGADAVHPQRVAFLNEDGEDRLVILLASLAPGLDWLFFLTDQLERVLFERVNRSGKKWEYGINSNCYCSAW